MFAVTEIEMIGQGLSQALKETDPYKSAVVIGMVFLSVLGYRLLGWGSSRAGSKVVHLFRKTPPEPPPPPSEFCAGVLKELSEAKTYYTDKQTVLTKTYVCETVGVAYVHANDKGTGSKGKNLDHLLTLHERELVREASTNAARRIQKHANDAEAAYYIHKSKGV